MAGSPAARRGSGGSPRGRRILLGSGRLRGKKMGIALGDTQEDFPEKEREREGPEQLGRRRHFLRQPRPEKRKGSSGNWRCARGSYWGVAGWNGEVAWALDWLKEGKERWPVECSRG